MEKEEKKSVSINVHQIEAVSVLEKQLFPNNVDIYSSQLINHNVFLYSGKFFTNNGPRRDDPRIVCKNSESCNCHEERKIF